MEQQQNSQNFSSPNQPLIHSVSLLTDYDIYLFKQGNHFHLYEKLGAHLITIEGLKGTLFAVWAPNAEQVSVIGDFNHWNPGSHPLNARKDESGIWEGFVPGVGHGALYKYHLISRHRLHTVQKGDPFAFFWEAPPRTASVVWDLGYEWGDQAWMTTRSKANALGAPQAIYELHPGSWKQHSKKDRRFLSFQELAHDLAEYIRETGFTHVQLLPVMEHPFYGSWGYQTVGYFAPTRRFGTPQDFMAFVDYLHRQGIGVILDWVPSHFPADEHGLFKFDGTHLYEHADLRKGFHPDWKSAIFNYGRQEVRSYLISSAVFWLKQYHADGLRADAVASMLYLDYSRQKGEWIPNDHGGRENLEAISFLKQLNETAYGQFPDIQTIAEESTAWPMVSKPTYLGGLGFGMKWNMGWMHDTLKFFSIDPLYRKYHYDLLTFSLWYAFSENFVLPLSHDEVVHGKGSLVGKMPGDEWQRFANLRLLFGLMYGHPGKKLLFMGGEFGQIREWNHEESLEWHILDYPFHRGVQRWVRDLNRVYKSNPALYEIDFEPEGFEWIDFQDREQGVLSFIRKGKSTDDLVAVVCNLTPVIRSGYRIGIPRDGFWREILNSDADSYAGSGCGNLGGVEASAIPAHGRPWSLLLTLPPLGVLFLSVKESLPFSSDNG